MTCGQLFVLCFKSLRRGKSQGKSSVGHLAMKLVSDWRTNKLSYSLAMETIKKRASFTSLPLYLDDVKSDKVVEKLTEGYDDGEVYETREVRIGLLGTIKKLQHPYKGEDFGL